MKQFVFGVVLLSLGLLAGLAVSSVSADEVASTKVSNGKDESGPHPLSDREIRLAVENELLVSDAIKSHKMRVSVEDGIVTLSGQVRNLLAEDIAVGLAQRVRGVISIVDQIEINALQRSDADLQKDATAALLADPGTHKTTAIITVKDGIARLNGDVQSNGMKTLVGNVVRGVVGIQDIDDQLTTDSKEMLSDDDLKKEISELLKYAVQLDQVKLDVAVKDGVVVLNGAVTTDSQRSAAEQTAWRTGAKDVDVRGIHVDWTHANPELRTARYEKATDEDISAAIARALKYDPRVLSFAPEVHVHHGVVTLDGTVGDLAAKRAAERTAQFTVGVRRVKNNIIVNWPESTPSDEDITEFTIAAMKRDPYLHGEEIIVNCENAHVELLGVVENNFEKNHAEWTAGRQKGVVHVDNYLHVRANWVPKTDAAITADLKDRFDLLMAGDQENEVTFKVTNGVAIVEGTVDTWFLWQQVFDSVIQAGAREPHMMVEVRNGTPASMKYSGPHYYVPQ